jgi:hypothetical protein
LRVFGSKTVVYQPESVHNSVLGALFINLNKTLISRIINKKTQAKYFHMFIPSYPDRNILYEQKINQKQLLVGDIFVHGRGYHM